MQKALIVGIDPGATVGIAMLDLSGRKVATASAKDGMREAAHIIERHGTPSLFACDVFPVPDNAQRIASYFSCRIYAPQRNIREDDKREVARGANVENTHERDAYCAAVFAYRFHANKLRQIDALSELADVEKEKVKHLLLRGYRIQDAFLLLKEPAVAEERQEEKKQASSIRQPTLDELRSRLESLARENANLRLHVERIEEEKQALIYRLRLFENGVKQSLIKDAEFRKLRFRLQRSMEMLFSRRRKRGKPNEIKKGEVRKEEKNTGTIRKENEAGKEVINNLGKEELDLEGIVAEYRRGRKY